MADGKEVSTFNAMDKMVASAMAPASVLWVSEFTINSPSTKQIITDFPAKYPEPTYTV
jgi:molybdopterin-containing oxidoreductase family iron-sulfur binding subunit